MAKECNVSYEWGLFPLQCLSQSAWAQSWPKPRVSVRLHVGLTLLHPCTLVSFVTELLCALDHSSNAFALAQDCHEIELHVSW